MKDAQPKAIYLKDYRQPDYWINKTHLSFDLEEEFTIVSSSLELTRNANAAENTPLVLHGQELELVSLHLNDKELTADDYSVDDETLVIHSLQQQNTLRCVTKIKPQDNTSLEGLYRSRTMYCTQCEAEGFRKITYYLDRPDVMSEFITKISADKKRYPLLLSNGNLIESGELDAGRHYAVWHDPFKKPCYLFALVAGDLACVEDSYTTMSGRDIVLRIFVEEKDLDKCDHAMTSLKNSMKWDEDVYGREYDLDIFMVVAVDDFNMGAMENKGLNIFNTSCVLAKPETTTDAGFQRVEGVVAHEYFHNWSGNRVTCRDWFQLSLKEGFTVFRDQEFSADMGSRTVKRVEDVSLLRTMQFAEDAGPMSHQVQPDSFIEISNFYTLTIYEKGSEIVRMIHTLLGPELFRKGSDLYFQRNDGKAATIDDFISAMADASGRDFSQFMHWYKQAGTPVVKARGQYNENDQTYTLELEQKLPSSASAKPFHIPVAMGLLGEAGSLPLKLQGQQTNIETEDNTHCVVEFTDTKQRFIFEGVKEEPVPALLRGFSAPVKLQYNHTRDDLVRLMTQDDDGFCRWDASQQFAVQVIHEVMAALVLEPAPKVDERFINALRGLLADSSLDPAMVALMLQLPSEAYLAELAVTVDVDSIHHARKRVERKIAQALHDDFMRVYCDYDHDRPYRATADDIARRSLKNIALHYLMLGTDKEAISLCERQWLNATNMTDELSAFSAIVHSTKSSLEELKTKAINDFYHKWRHEALVINHWFSVQASAPGSNTLMRVKELMEHSAFDIKNPNKLRSLIGSFTMRNPINFHNAKGEGYSFLADRIIYLNTTNPQIAARLLTPLTKWKRYDENRQNLMKAELERIKVQPKLSKDVYEVVTKSLG
ncbi:aminopeptidase N [Agarilytica rhodophyticola]|uniref:aminopeptidase N n=1 Tax=Agarilytica rhodophyticola TaxID=1737490 RepID=UPI000B3438DB|nr:aminopeptidase N [Agarilytica rhodophyticola]